MNNWNDLQGNAPWGPDTIDAVRRYLATVTPEEHVALAEAAMLNLDWGGWQGLETKNGGWVDGPPWDDDECNWRATAKDFVERYQNGDRTLGEGMIAYAAWDLARELAWLRRWCPRRAQNSA